MDKCFEIFTIFINAPTDLVPSATRFPSLTSDFISIYLDFSPFMVNPYFQAVFFKLKCFFQFSSYSRPQYNMISICYTLLLIIVDQPISLNTVLSHYRFQNEIKKYGRQRIPVSQASLYFEYSRQIVHNAQCYTSGYALNKFSQQVVIGFRNVTCFLLYLNLHVFLILKNI